MAHGGLRQEIDPRAVEAYFALGYVPDPWTIYRHAQKLAPGHRLLVKRGEPLGTPQRYWDVKFTLNNRMGQADAAPTGSHRIDGHCHGALQCSNGKDSALVSRAYAPGRTQTTRP